jgi:hypothetical protein
MAPPRHDRDRLTLSEAVLLVAVSAIGLAAAGMLICFGVPLAMALL